MNNINVVLLILFLALCACTSHKKPRPDIKVTTHITETGFKKFQVALARDDNKGQRQKNNGPAKGKGSGPDNNRSKASRSSAKRGKRAEQTQNMRHRIERIISKYGYCREGFSEIDRYSEAGTVYFNGQCNELATKVDRQKYINN